MGSRMLLVSVLGLLLFTDHSQGVSEKKEQTGALGTDVPAAGEPLANPVRTQRVSNCKAQELMNRHSLCDQLTQCEGKYKRWKKMCKRKRNTSLKKCKWFSKLLERCDIKKSKPSVPL